MAETLRETVERRERELAQRQLEVGVLDRLLSRAKAEEDAARFLLSVAARVLERETKQAEGGRP